MVSELRTLIALEVPGFGRLTDVPLPDRIWQRLQTSAITSPVTNRLLPSSSTKSKEISQKDFTP